MITGNKGEWSEVYAFLKVIADRQLFGGNANLERIEGVIYPLIKIIREETGGSFEYLIEGDLVIIYGNEELKRVKISDFSRVAGQLLEKINKSKGSFENPEIELFLNSIFVKTLKAKSISKSDIYIVVHDKILNQQVGLGFSIKSQLGNVSTLLNAGKTTNFIFSIINSALSREDIDYVNNIDTKSKIKDRISYLLAKGTILKFESTESDVFFNNLVLIDSLLPNILAYCLLKYYSLGISDMKLLISDLEQQNPLNFDSQYSHKFYEYKIKRFLTDVALGMVPSKVWLGRYDANGGYIIVKSSGEVLCYHIYDKNLFEEYLLENTKLDTASSTRHDFGKLYLGSNNDLYINLNLQIRFK